MNTLVKIFKRTKLDLFICLCFPALLFVLFYLPENIKEVLKLNPTSPIPLLFLQTISSSYIHQKLIHFLGNILVFFIILIPFLLILYNLNKKQKIYVFLFIFILLPLINSFVHLIVSIFYKTDPSCGASAIVISIVFFVVVSYIITIIKYLRASSYQKTKTKENFIFNKLKYIILFLYILSFIIIIVFYAEMMVYTEEKLNLGHIIGIIFGIVLGFIKSKKEKKKETKPICKQSL